MDKTLAIARWEFRASVRTRWVLGCGAAFALSTVGVALVGMRSVSELGLTGIGPAASSLLGLAMLLPPLVGLLLGAGAIAGARERGVLQMMLVQPGVRAIYVFGAFLGLAATVWAILGAGLGTAGLVLSTVADMADVRAFAGIAAATFGAATAAVAMGMLVSTMSRSRSQATAWCVVLWFFFGIGADLVLVSLVPALDIGTGGIMVALFLNPVETARTLAMLIIDPQLSALGPFGAYVTWELGTGMGAALLVSALVAWCALPLGIAGAVLRRLEP